MITEGKVISFLKEATEITIVDYSGDVVAEISEDGVVTDKDVQEVRISYTKGELRV